jgi:hypothetical protein
MIRRIVLLALPLLVSGTIAQAVTLSTPVVVLSGSPNRTSGCIVTNVGTSPAAVSVALFDFSGNEIVPAPDQCAIFSPLDPHESCTVTAPQLVDVSCVINSSSKNLRGSLHIFDETGDVLEVVPATAK